MWLKSSRLKRPYLDKQSSLFRIAVEQKKVFFILKIGGSGSEPGDAPPAAAHATPHATSPSVSRVQQQPAQPLRHRRGQQQPPVSAEHHHPAAKIQQPVRGRTQGPPASGPLSPVTPWKLRQHHTLPRGCRSRCGRFGIGRFPVGRGRANSRGHCQGRIPSQNRPETVAPSQGSQIPGAKIIKRFPSSLTKRLHKLDCLPVASLLSRV